ncbi:MAG: hypothetical protein D6805_01945 [Planctomycetota bacterium]|nr:MAG: hypothetical protein D6805_01945 [Planctomycetota bacterium]
MGRGGKGKPFLKRVSLTNRKFLGSLKHPFLKRVSGEKSFWRYGTFFQKGSEKFFSYEEVFMENLEKLKYRRK